MNELKSICFTEIARIYSLVRDFEVVVNNRRGDEYFHNKSAIQRGIEVESEIIEKIRRGQAPSALKPILQTEWSMPVTLSSVRGNSLGEEFMLKAKPDLMIRDQDLIQTLEIKSKGEMTFLHWLQAAMLIVAAKDEFRDRYGPHYVYYSGSQSLFEIDKERVFELENEIDVLCLAAIGILGSQGKEKYFRENRGETTVQSSADSRLIGSDFGENYSRSKSSRSNIHKQKFDENISYLRRKWGSVSPVVL